MGWAVMLLRPPMAVANLIQLLINPLKTVTYDEMTPCDMIPG